MIVNGTGELDRRLKWLFLLRERERESERKGGGEGGEGRRGEGMRPDGEDASLARATRVHVDKMISTEIFLASPRHAVNTLGKILSSLTAKHSVPLFP